MCIIKRTLLYVFLVLNGVGLSVALCLKLGLGSDSIGLLCDGIHRYFKIGFGYASFLYNLVIIMIAFLFARKQVALGTVAYALTSGFFIDFYLIVLDNISFMELGIIWRSLGFLFSHSMLALSLAVLIQLKLGMNALDALLYQLSAKTKIKYRVLRTSADIMNAVVGTALGGVFGIGTVISVLTTGIFVSYFVKRLATFEKYYQISEVKG